MIKLTFLKTRAGQTLRAVFRHHSRARTPAARCRAIPLSCLWFAGSVLLLACNCLFGSTQTAGKTFAFVNSQYIITAETGTTHSFIVNFINLSDFVIVVQPNEFIYKGTSGRFYIGQVYEQEHKDNRGERFRYTASVLLKGRSFTGLTVLGAFHEQDQIEELSVRIGAKRYYLQPLDKLPFDQLAANPRALMTYAHK